MKRILLLSFMLTLGCAISAFAQRTVSGTVTSQEDGSGIPGVNVVLKGTTTGTTTDLDGNYRLSVPEEGGTLQFSFIGLEPQELEIGARSVIDVKMASDVKQLTEVVVTGFGIERAPNEITYQTEKVDSELLMQGQQQVVGAGLAGKVAGMQINVQNNGVNPQTQILLRGLRSISANNQPMIVIDGAVADIGAFNDLNPLDIQSIDVLKGANAGALYGSRAANGAVIVTTKQGKKGQAFTVGVNSSLTFEQVAYMPDFQTEHGLGWDGSYDPIENTNWGPRFDGVVRQVGPDFPDGYPLTEQMLPYAPIKDNLKDFYETGTTFQNTAYVSGGDETSTFYMSFGNVNTKGLIPDDEYSRNTFKVNATKKMGKLKFALNSSYLSDETDIVASRIGDQERPLYWFVLNTAANVPLSSYKDWQNPLSYAHADNYFNAYYQNPYWAVGTNRDTDKSSRLVANVNGAYDITDKINLSARLGVNKYTDLGKEWRDAQSYNGDIQCCHSAVSSYLQDFEEQFNEINGNVLLSGSFNLTSDITLKPILGASFISTEQRESTVTANNLSIPGFYDISNGTGQIVASVDQYQKRTFGIFTDITLGYKDWAFLNFAGRQDYTSTLPLDNNGYFYPATSLSVVLSDAIPSITDNPVLSFLKLTASNATVYNDLGIYALNERYSQPNNFPYGTINGFAKPGQTVDANIQKEKLNTTELGVNIGVFNDRFNIDASYFNTVITDLITNSTPSIASGATRFLTNIGQLTSTGYEVTVNGYILKVGDFAWNVNFNYSTYETVVDEIKDDIREIALDDFGTYGTYAIVGKAFPQIKAQSYVRDPQGRVVIDPSTGNPLIGEVTAQGKTTPDYIIGFTNVLKWKGISASATLDYRTGHVYYSQGSDQMEFTGRSLESVSSNRQDFVFPNSSYETSDGVFVENTSIPISGGVMGFWQNTYNDIKENYVKDATALKIREVQVSYALPQSILSKTGFMKKASVGFVGRNLWTKLAGGQNRFSDPEFRNTGGNNNSNGIGIGGYLQGPPTRSYGFSVNVEF